MKCSKAEKFISKDLDNRLSPKEKKLLEEHVKLCPDCAEAQKEYLQIVHVLRGEKLPHPFPGYLERLLARIEAKSLPYDSPLPAWQRWPLKALPVALLIVFILIIASLLLVSPQSSPEISKAELLFQNKYPFTESRELLEEPGVENKNIKLLFTSLDESSQTRRYLP